MSPAVDNALKELLFCFAKKFTFTVVNVVVVLKNYI